MAAQRSAPLRSVKRTMMGEIIFHINFTKKYKSTYFLHKKSYVDKHNTWAYNMFIRYGLLAQLVRALHSHCRGHKFESCTVHQFAFRLGRFFYVRRKDRLFIYISILFRSLLL